MYRLPSLIALTVAPGLLLTGCGQGSTAAAPSTTSSAVPDGVAEQYQVLEEEVAARGGRTSQGDWTISYIVEAAEPWFETHGSHRTFREPRAGETHHIEIIPTERATGRIVPDVPITLAVVDDSGEVVEERRLDFYHSTFFHYATNFHIEEPGTYTLRATVGAPAFNRHGEPDDQPALDSGVRVEFPGVELVEE